jgi:RND family efflux transporter MFP subunit
MENHKILILLGLIMAFLTGCGEYKPENQPNIRKVKIASVEPASQDGKKEFSGIIRESRAVNLSFRVAGPIAKMYVKQGDFVKQGSLVAEMDTRDYRLQLSVAQAEYDKVTAETSRVSELYKRNAVTEADYQKAVAGEKMITAQLNRAKDQLNDTKLYAPFSGYIQTVNFEQGEIINIGMPVAELLDMNSFQVEIDIPSTLFVIRDRFKKVSCRLSVNNAPEMPLQLVNYQSKANSSRMYRLFYRLNPNANPNMAPGMEVLVSIEYSCDDNNRLIVPLSALFIHDGKSHVWVLNTSDSTVTKQAVEPGALAENGKVIVQSGLKGDETIVVSGVHVLNDNEKVHVIEPVSKTNIGGIL